MNQSTQVSIDRWSFYVSARFYCNILHIVNMHTQMREETILLCQGTCPWLPLLQWEFFEG